MTTTQQITTVAKRNQVGVNRNGQPVGYAVKVSRAQQAEQWTAFVYIQEPPFDTTRTGFRSADDAVAFIAKNGTTPDYMRGA